MGTSRQHGDVHHQASGGPRSHEHLWTASDGTGLHVPPGQVVRDSVTGEVCCHVCGKFFRALGSHVRSHGYTSAEFRRVMGLSRTRPLSSADVSAAISRRQRESFAASPEHRQRLATGQEMVRDGRLTERARSTNGLRMQSDLLRSTALDQGRRTREIRRKNALAERLDELGIDELGPWLRNAYADGASVSGLAETLGIGRQRLRKEFEAADIDIRARGVNSARGKSSRARTNDELAAERVGTDDVIAWLRERRRSGESLSRLARMVGHSTHWVRWRLDAPSMVKPPEATSRAK